MNAKEASTSTGGVSATLILTKEQIESIQEAAVPAHAEPIKYYLKEIT
jgi:hypothetical protein